MAPPRAWRWRKLLDFRGSQMRHEEEKPEIGWNMEVEVDQGMHQESGARHSSRDLQGTGKRKVILAKMQNGLAQQNYEEPGTAEAAQHAGFCEGLKIIIVRVIDNFAVVQSFVARINDLQRAESRAR